MQFDRLVNLLNNLDRYFSECLLIIQIIENFAELLIFFTIKEVRMMKRLSCCVTVLLLLMSVSAYAGSAKGWGTQTRGHGPGMNAQLNGQPLVIPGGVTATISGVSCNSGSFWIQGGGTYAPAKSAVGSRLSGGTYYVYPNLNSGQNNAEVQVTATW